MLYSVLEQHVDNSWWYHPKLTFNSPEEAEEEFKKCFYWDLGRPYKIFEHKDPLPQKDICTFDFKVFHFHGLVEWPKELKGQCFKEQ